MNLIKHLTLLLFFTQLWLGHIVAQDKYAVLIGVESYDPSVLTRLEFAEDDAIGLCESLTGLGFKTKVMTGQSRVSTGKPTTPSKILRVLKTQMNNCSKEDTLVISFSGHGLQFGDDKPDSNGIRETYFCPEDADPNDKDSLLPISSVVELLKQCEAGRKLFLVDACRNEFANTSGQKKAAKKLRLSSVHETRQSVPGGTTILYSCAPKQFSFEDSNLKHSVFSYFVINFLNGNAESRYYDSDKVSLDGLTRYVRKKTNEYVADNNLSADGQTPVYSGTSTDWALGTGVSPIKKVLNRHFVWRGGLEKIRKIKTIISTNNHTLNNKFGTTIFKQDVLIKGKRFNVKNWIDGQLFNEATNLDGVAAWSVENDGTVIDGTSQTAENDWLVNHPFALVELLDRTDELSLSKQLKGDVNADVITLGNSSGNHVSWYFDKEGRLFEMSHSFNGSDQVSTFEDYQKFKGVKFWMVAKYVTEKPDFVSDVDRVAALEMNVAIDDTIFEHPKNTKTTTNKPFDIDAMVVDYNMFKQEYAQPYLQQFQGMLTDVEFRKSQSDVITINLKMSQNVPDGVNLTQFQAMVPEFKKQMRNEMDDAERTAVRAGLKYDFRLTAPNGYVPFQFYFTVKDL